MLGTLPSTYLTWVSKNLRARDFEEWAQLADQVLEDPVYKDRIEWEFAEKVLNGDVLGSSLFSRGGDKQSSVAKLAEISEQFGWDNEDKLSWAKVDFGLLGTSSGGRIPRLSDSGPRTNNMGLIQNVQRMKGGNKVGLARVSFRPKPNKKDPTQTELEEERKRRERRDRSKLRRKVSLENGGHEGNSGNSHDVFLETCRLGYFDKEESEGVNIKKSPFPGREAFLKKVLQRKGL